MTESGATFDLYLTGPSKNDCSPACKMVSLSGLVKTMCGQKSGNNIMGHSLVGHSLVGHSLLGQAKTLIEHVALFGIQALAIEVAVSF